jgi:hypothetical protein
MMQKKINTKIFCMLTLTFLITSTIFAAIPASSLPTVDPTAKVNLKGSKTITLTASDIASMPTYTGAGSPRRNGGVFPLQMLGNYTGVPLLYLCNLVGGISSSSIITVSTTVDGFSGTLTYDQVHDNIYPQYNISTHEVISGQHPIIILAYGVNGTTLTSDGTDTDTDLGGPLRLFVVSNNGTSPILMNDGMATFGNTFTKYVTDIEITNPGSLTFKTCDSTGATKNNFNSSSTVYFSATGLSASTTYPIYVVKDTSAWTVRVPFPARVSGSASSVTTDNSGNINPTSVYENAESGTYAVLVDVNSNNQFDEADLIITSTTITGTVTPTGTSPTSSTEESTTPTSTLAPTATSLTSSPSDESSATSSDVPLVVVVPVLLVGVVVVFVIILKKANPEFNQPSQAAES